MENQVSFSYQCITVRQRTAPYPFVHSSPLILCTFFALFDYCTLFMLHLFSCCFMLHSFHVALFSYCTLFKFLFLGVVHFSCFTFSMLHFFHVELFSCCTFFMLHRVPIAPFCVLHFFHASPFLLLSHVALCS